MSHVLKTEMIDRDGLTYRIEHILDESPDLSWLGEYTDKPEVPYYDRLLDAIVIARLDNGLVRTRDARGHLATVDERPTYDRREYRYIAGFQCPESVKACLQDAKRLEAYEAQDWCMVGVKVTLMLDGEETDGESSLWGIESDSDDGTFKEVTDDMIAQIDARKVLADLAKTRAEQAEAARRALAKLPTVPA